MGRHRPELSETGYKPRYTEPFEFRHAAPKKGKRKMRAPRWAKLCVFFGVLLVLLSSSAAGAQWLLFNRYLGGLEKADLLGNNRSAGPPKVDGPLTFLLLGTDKRTEEDFDPKDPSSRTWATEGERADTIIVVHVPEDMKDAYVISIPRDTLVDIPPSEDGKFDGGEDKINAAYNFGGAPLMISTVNKLLGIKVDYPIILSFQAVRKLTDAVGGVDVVVDETTQDYRSLEIFKAGKQRLNGKRAEAYVRQRKAICPGDMPVTDPEEKQYLEECSLQGSDYARQARQQQFIHAIAGKISEGGMLSNISKVDKLIKVMTDNVVVDQSMPIQGLVFALKHLRPGSVTYLKFPIAETDMEYWNEIKDDQKTMEMGQAIRNGTMKSFLQKYPELRNNVEHGQ